MGLDLQLLPVSNRLSSQDWFSHTVLDCERRRGLFEAIQELRGERVPETFHTYVSRDAEYEESHYGNTQTTSYDEPLKHVSVRELLFFASHEGVKDNPLNSAIWAYLSELPPEMRVALYWY